MVRELMENKERRDYFWNIFGWYGDKKLTHEEMLEDMERDRKANEQGINAPKDKSCEQSCISLLDDLKESRKPFMEEYFNK